jgi:hypothetical protein
MPWVASRVSTVFRVATVVPGHAPGHALGHNFVPGHALGHVPGLDLEFRKFDYLLSSLSLSRASLSTNTTPKQCLCPKYCPYTPVLHDGEMFWHSATRLKSPITILAVGIQSRFCQTPQLPTDVSGMRVIVLTMVPRSQGSCQGTKHVRRHNRSCEIVRD